MRFVVSGEAWPKMACTSASCAPRLRRTRALRCSRWCVVASTPAGALVAREALVVSRPRGRLSFSDQARWRSRVLLPGLSAVAVFAAGRWRSVSSADNRATDDSRPKPKGVSAPSSASTRARRARSTSSCSLSGRRAMSDRVPGASAGNSGRHPCQQQSAGGPRWVVRACCGGTDSEPSCWPRPLAATCLERE